jgi:NAD(P)-dependent dehydrogenase (short-subunit alcohol dehydrogenase family)
MGRVDIIVNNAGTNIVNPVDKIVDDDWDRLLELNLTAPMILVRELAGQMKERKWGRVINISSIFGLCAKEERGSYSATKSGLIGITRTMAQELAPWGITANAIAPGPISTPLTDRLVQGELRAYFDSMMPLGRWGTPEDLIGPVLLLASDAGSFITGTTLTVDGGWMTR